MSDKISELAGVLSKTMENAGSKKTSPYDTVATVTRVDEDGTAWVSIPGGVRETPAGQGTTVKTGDQVEVRVSGGRAIIQGNYTAPPTDDTRANQAYWEALSAADSAAKAASEASRAKEAADSAEESAVQAKQTTDEINAYAQTAGKTVTQILNDGETAAQGVLEVENSLKSVVQGATTVEKAVSVMQTALEAVVDYDPQNDTTTEYFWHDANGAHVLGTSGDYRNDITSTGMEIVDTSTEEAVAKFGASGAQIGQAGSSNMTVDTTGIRGANVDNVEMFSVDMDGATRTIEARQSYSSREFDAWIDTSHTSPTLSHGAYVSLSSSATTISVSPGEFVLKLRSRAVPFPNTSSITVTNGSISSRENYTLTIATNQIQFNVGTSGSATVSVACTNMTGIGGINADIVIAYDGNHFISFDYYLWINSGSDYPVMFLLNSYIISSYDTPAPSYTLGTRSGDNGPFSAVIGEGVTAEYEDQTAVGKFNDNQSTNALEIGNGTADNARSNALTVDWSGNVEAAGDIEDGSGNVLANKIESSWHCYGNYYRTTSITLSTTDKKVPLSVFSGSGCSESSNGIKIDSSHAGTYAISGAIYASTGYTANDIVHAVIYKNSTLIGDAGKRVSNASPYEIIPVGPLVVSLAAGDVVYLYARNQSGARGTVANYGNDQLNVGLNIYRIG